MNMTSKKELDPTVSYNSTHNTANVPVIMRYCITINKKAWNVCWTSALLYYIRLQT